MGGPGRPSGGAREKACDSGLAWLRAGAGRPRSDADAAVRSARPGDSDPWRLAAGVEQARTEEGCQQPLRLESEPRRQPKGSQVSTDGADPRAALLAKDARFDLSGISRQDPEGRPR